ncbi:MAG: hypothetical protein ACUVXJ_12670 [Phycisphaerae bacterium]
MGDTGLEHPDISPVNPHLSAKPGTDSGTLAPTPAPGDILYRPLAMPDDLADVVAAWPTLPAALRAGILAMVKAAKGAR